MAIQQGARRLLRKAAISDGGLEMEKLNVAIADDNEKMIDLLETLIKEDNELELVGHANNGADIYDIIKEKEPDVVLLDIIMPKVDGLTVMWCATRQVDKLNNENFFLPRYSLCTGLFMQRFLVFVHGIPVV